MKKEFPIEIISDKIDPQKLREQKNLRRAIFIFSKKIRKKEPNLFRLSTSVREIAIEKWKRFSLSQQILNIAADLLRAGKREDLAEIEANYEFARQL